MALRIFETDEAKYFFGFSTHWGYPKGLFDAVDFKDLDFMVLESGSTSVEEREKLLWHPQYREVIERIYTENVGLGIYTVDCVPSQTIADAEKIVDEGVITIM